MGGHCGRCAGFLAFVVLAATLVSGCSGAQGASGPGVSPSGSASGSATSSPSSSASATLDDAARARIPKAARAHTAKGAEAFARFYLQQVNKAWMAPDPELIRPYALESCKTCANYVHAAEWLGDQHLRYDGPPTEIGPAGWLPESTKDKVLVQIVNNQLRRRILQSDGSVEETVPAVPALNEVELRWHNGAWLAAAVRVAK